MWDVIFAAALIFVAVKLLILGIKATWGITKILATVVLLPLFIAGLAVAGLFYLAVPILIIAGIISFVL